MYPKILLNILYEGIEDYEGLRLLTEFTMDQYEFGDVGLDRHGLLGANSWR